MEYRPRLFILPKKRAGEVNPPHSTPHNHLPHFRTFTGPKPFRGSYTTSSSIRTETTARILAVEGFNHCSRVLAVEGVSGSDLACDGTLTCNRCGGGRGGGLEAATPVNGPSPDRPVDRT